MQIPYYEKINENISCSGQPRVEHFKYIADGNYDIVINLTTDDNIGSLKDERELVEGFNMKYVHLPVKWGEPQLYDVLKFFALMSGARDKKVWVHCTLNMRSSTFIYLYQKFIIKEDVDIAKEAMDRHCELTPSWNDVIDQVASLHR